MRIIEQVKSKHKAPIVGIIGSVELQYESEHIEACARAVGYSTRWLNPEVDIFADGDLGVGLSAYSGVVEACLDNRGKDGFDSSDHFFVLVPKDILIVEDQVVLKPYKPPQEYASIGQMLNKEVEVHITNRDDHYKVMAELADILVIIGGAGNTLLVALEMLTKNKPIIPFKLTGGAANMLSRTNEAYSDNLEKISKFHYPKLNLQEKAELIQPVVWLTDLPKMITKLIGEKNAQRTCYC